MPSKSKSKGSSYERDMAKFLSEKYGDSFVRVPNSGAYIGGSNNHRTVVLSEGQVRSFKGDIIPPDDWKYFNCECKNYADLPFHQIISGNGVAKIDSWIDQTMEVADEKDFNVLFIKITRKGEYVMIQDKLFQNGMFVQPGVEYTSKNHGKWWFLGAELFWNKCSTEVKDVSVKGFAAY